MSAVEPSVPPYDCSSLVARKCERQHLCYSSGMTIKTASLGVVFVASTAILAMGCSSSRSASSPSSTAATATDAKVGGNPNQIDMAGLVSGLGGQCPDRTFFMGNVQVVVSSATAYPAGSCASLVFTQRVVVTGTLKKTTLTASSILQQKNKDGV